MDSNSDGSFVWTDASDDSSDSEIMKENAGSGEEEPRKESPSGKHYKKTLHQQLFSNGEAHTRKRKMSEATSDSEHMEKQNKRIKIEPDSDLDSKRIKKKKSCSNISEVDSDDFLNQMVKNEQSSADRSPRTHAKRKSKIIQNTDGCSPEPLYDPPHEDTATSRHSGESIPVPDDSRKHKTKRKKSKHSKDIIGDNIIENGSTLYDSTNENDASSATPDAPARTERERRRSASTRASTGSEGSTTSGQRPKRKPTLSDRITFENDSHDERGRSRSPVAGRLRAFVRAQAALRVLERTPGALPAPDDELWLVSCPADVDAASFRGRPWPLDGRRIKLGGHSYEGAALERPRALCAAAGGAVRALRVRGAVRLRRRAPRAPPPAPPAPPSPPPCAPAVRARHPLLGVHYRARLRLRRRRPAPAPSPPRPRKRRSRPAADAWDSERAIEETLFAF